MNVFLLRHGNAEPMAERDRDRRLTARGREEVAMTACTSGKELGSVTDVWVSPYRRAQQSFGVVGESIASIKNAHTQTTEAITPDGHPDQVIDLMYRAGCESLLLVSHQPLIGVLLDELCGFETGQYRMGTGSLAYLKFDQFIAKGLGELVWLKHP